MSPDQKKINFTVNREDISRVVGGLDRRPADRPGTAHRKSSRSVTYYERQEYALMETELILRGEPEELTIIHSAERGGFYHTSKPLSSILILRARGKTVVATIDEEEGAHVYNGDGASRLAATIIKELKLA